MVREHCGPRSSSVEEHPAAIALTERRGLCDASLRRRRWHRLGHDAVLLRLLRRGIDDRRRCLGR